MFNVTKKSIQWGGETLTLETGKVARQADGSVIATLGETSVMANVTFAKAPKPGQDFFPLTVHYQEKYYAAGKIPGGFFKREARPSEKETLTSRLIDRPCRPLFVEGFKNEVLVMATVLSCDLHNDPDVVAMIDADEYLMPMDGSNMASLCQQYPNVQMLGPLLSPLERKAGKYRWQLHLYARQRPQLHQLLASLLLEIPQWPLSRKIKWQLDVDALDLS